MSNNLSKKNYEELYDLLRNSAPSGDQYKQVSAEINKIQQDTNNTQTANLIKSIEKLDKTTDLYSKVIILLTSLLLVIGLFQLVATIIDKPKTFWGQITVEVFILGSVLFFEWILLKKLFK